MKKSYVFFACLLVFIGVSLCTHVYAKDDENILPANTGLEKNVSGIEYSCVDGVYHISGTPEKSSYLNLCGSTTTIPKCLVEGETLKISFNSGTNYIALGIRAFNEEYPDGKWLVKTSVDTEFVVPDLSEYTGVSIRLLVSKSDGEFDVYVTPIITKVNIDRDNLIPKKDDFKKSVNGVTYTYTDGIYNISGTPIKSSYLELCGSTKTIPSCLVPGEKLKISFNSETNYIVLGIRAFNEEYPDGKWLVKTSVDTEFVVPDLSEYTGVSIRLLVSKTDRRFDTNVIPQITKINTGGDNLIPEKGDFVRKVNGVSYIYLDGVYHINGIPTKSSYLELCGSTKTIPAWLVEGETLKISFNSGTKYITLGIRAFSEEYPDGKWLMKTAVDTKFVVPDLSEYTGVSVRITVSQANQKFDMDVNPVITKVDKTSQVSYLTIIDDDGDIHFLTDIVPLVQELNVPIATAVTTTRIGTSNRWMDWADIEACYQAGCEILCHTYSHPTGTGILSMDDETIIANYQKAYDELNRRGYPGADILVYSSSTGNIKRVQEAASKVFKCGIKIGGSEVNDVTSDKFALSRYRIDYASTEGRTDWNYSDMMSFIDTVATEGGWEIWMFHTSKASYRQRVETDEQGNAILDSAGNPIPMVDSKGNPVLDVDGTYLTMGDVVYVPMLRNAILYAQSKGVQIVTAEYAYDMLYGDKE